MRRSETRPVAPVYSVGPRPKAPVSAPMTWDELAGGRDPEDFMIRTGPERLREGGDLWRPLLAARGRFALDLHAGTLHHRSRKHPR